MNRNRLRGLVFSRYKTIVEFSQAIGWGRNKSSRILNGDQEPDGEDMICFAKLFNLSTDEFIEIFFECWFTKCTDGKKDAS